MVVSFFFWRDSDSKSEIVLGVADDGEGIQRELELGKTESKSAFPIDTAFASGFVPKRIEGIRDLKLWAGSSVAIDVDSHTILHYDNGRKKVQVASLTKIMTALIVMERIEDLNEIISIPKQAAYIPGTVVGCPRTGYCLSNRLYAGERIRVIDLMKAMLMNSANDAAFSLAVHIGGSEAEFAKIMNERARELGLKDTNFCTASGLEPDGRESECYSSAYDIARITAETLKHDIIWKIMRIPEDQIYSADGKYMHQLKNTDILLGELPNCLGGKTGFTPLAGKSLLMAATDQSGEHKVVMVILNDEDRWEDMRLLNSWVFGSYEWK